MIKTATLTFHASHNYGSMLQAYALQKVIQELGCDNEIVNLRTDAQKRIYPKPYIRVNKSIKSNIKSLLINTLTWGAIADKYNRFEKFLNDDLLLSKNEYSTVEELEALKSNYDFFISGSDQIWNTICGDFTWAYFLPFATNNGIAYAPSMGPKGKQQVNPNNYEKIAKCLCNYKAISVREQGTADVIESITGEYPTILVDPTMLLSKSDWESKINKTPIIKEPYIFLYSPGYNEKLYNITEKLSQLLNIKVVVSNVLYLPSMLKFHKFIYKLNVGPWEFLNLIKNASVVLSGSFHAVVFSILLERPFFAKDGMEDNRISNILRLMNLEDRSIDLTNIKEKAAIAYDIDYKDKDAFLNKEKERSIQFLKTALGL